jgi:superfamily I DNA/RNA helicase
VEKNFQLTVYNIAARANGFEDREILLRLDCLIKTKTPKFEQYYATRSEIEERKAIKKILAVYEGIQKGVFVPNDGSWKCAGCAFKKPCEKWLTEVVMGKNKRQKGQIPLNKEQEEAANFIFGVASVIAVAGSGKTLTMTKRIGNLLQVHQIPPEKILGLTFTRNSAEAMRTRLIPVLDDLAARVTLTTIHSFCHFLLRSEGKTFEILTGKNQIIFIREVMKRLRIKDLSVGLVPREISLAKNNLIPVNEFREIYTGDRTMLTVADIYQAYDEEKSRQLLLDFEDLVLESYHLLKDNEAIREKYRETYRHLLVDEYQDSNFAQLELLKILAEPNEDGSMFVVGDDCQSIYGFMGASIGNILNFKEIFPGSKEFIRFGPGGL